LTASRTPPARCPECSAFVAAGAEACKRCGASLRQPAAASESSSGGRGWSSMLATALETLFVVAILGSLIGAIWLMRPEAPELPAALPGPRPTPTPLPTSTPTFTRTPTPTSTSTPTITPTPTPSFYVHRVEAGDTLIAIALEYGVLLDTILDANDLSKDDLLHIGQELIIPLGADVDLPTATATRLPSAGFNVITHTIQAGDTLGGIAVLYNTSIADIVEANALSGPEELLNIGDVLVIPAEAADTDACYADAHSHGHADADAASKPHAGGTESHAALHFVCARPPGSARRCASGKWGGLAELGVHWHPGGRCLVRGAVPDRSRRRAGSHTRGVGEVNFVARSDRVGAGGRHNSALSMGCDGGLADGGGGRQALESAQRDSVVPMAEVVRSGYLPKNSAHQARHGSVSAGGADCGACCEDMTSSSSNRGTTT